MRGQYTRGGTRDELMAGYREEPGVDPLSQTETYAALRLEVDNWRWAGVPFYLRTGKRLPRRVTEVALQFQRPPHLPIAAGAGLRAGRGRAGAADPAGRGHRAALRRQGARAQLPGPHGLHAVLVRRVVPGGVARGVRAAAAGRAGRRPDAVHPLGRGAAVLADHRPGDRALGHRPQARSRRTRPGPGGRTRPTGSSSATAAPGATPSRSGPGVRPVRTADRSGRPGPEPARNCRDGMVSSPA